MKSIPWFALLVVVAILFSGAAFSTIIAQDQSTVQAEPQAEYYEIETKKGETYYGRIASRKNNQIVLILEDGVQITIPEEQVKKISKIDQSQIQKGSYWRPMPHYTNYYFANSAFMLEKGEGYYSNAYIFFNSLNYGITDWLTVGGGLEIISTFASETPALGYFRIKAGKQLTNKVRLSGGLLTFTTSELDQSASLLFSSLTIGRKEKQTTLGLGFNLVDAGNQAVALNFSHMSRWRKRTAFVTENWVFTGSDSFNIFTYGLRFFGPRLSVDLAFLNNAEIIEFLPIGVPYVGFQVAF
jgi:hypothetical protein